ncbi:MAG: hypothetical protein KAW61_05660 [candidate division Zixibacteria bacterium]|nr:hypothetical protein [candidate division Zixibacteria bacterium]
MLDTKFQRGFTPEKLAISKEPRIRKDDSGYFVMSLSENNKVYFDDYYRFMEMVYSRSQAERALLDQKIAATPLDSFETVAYYRARGVIVDLVIQSVRRFYTDGANLGVIMTPWCFGTVMLEKVEVYRDRLGKGEVQDANVPEFPYYVIRYIDEIYKTTLLELFDFPEKAFQMRWQYSELLKKYSRILSNITTSLNSVLGMVRNYGS